eukprot:SAG31_NODE_6637_length_1943_cov_1.436009_2_plen_78_part_00
MHMVLPNTLAATLAPIPYLQKTSDCSEAVAARPEAELRAQLRRYCNLIIHSHLMAMLESAKNHALQQVVERTATPRP